jgi:hypothetical protein
VDSVTPRLLETWTEEVQRRFKSGIPNGWLLGWNPLRFHKELAVLLKEGEFENVTSFDYDFCNTYNFRLAAALREYEMLTLQISFIVDAYSLHWARYRDGGRLGEFIRRPESRSSLTLEVDVRAFLEKRGIRECDDECYNTKMVGIRTELGGSDPILGKCLFADYEG